MLTNRLFPIFIILALLDLFMPGTAIAAHGSGGGGGHSGGARASYGGAHHSSGNASAGHYYSAAASHASNYSGAASHASYVHAGNYSAAAAGVNYAHAGNANLAYNGSWNGNSWHQPGGGNNWGRHDWDHYFNRGYGYGYGYGNGYWGSGWGGYGWGGWGWGYPFGLSLWWGYPYGWGGYSSDYFCPYGPYAAAASPVAMYGYDYANDGPYAGAGQYVVNSPPAPSVSEQSPPPAAAEQSAPGLQYYNQARAAFEQGNYQDALRLAGHAGVESPQNPKVHELTLLALFASGDYRDAATEAHAALALGPPSSWGDLYSYYNDNAKYTEQLRKLERTVGETPQSAPAQFLLGYQYLMTGANAAAKAHFALAAKLTPNDKLAQHILQQLDSGGAVTPPQLPQPPAAPTGQAL